MLFVIKTGIERCYIWSVLWDIFARRSKILSRLSNLAALHRISPIRNPLSSSNSAQISYLLSSWNRHKISMKHRIFSKASRGVSFSAIFRRVWNDLDRSFFIQRLSEQASKDGYLLFSIFEQLDPPPASSAWSNPLAWLMMCSKLFLRTNDRFHYCSNSMSLHIEFVSAVDTRPNDKSDHYECWILYES